MIVCDTNIPYAFIHNPRTSGTSISDYLVEHANGRILSNIIDPGYRLHSIYAEETRYRSLDNHFVFGFVRNPFSREYSLFNLYRKRINNHIDFKTWLIDYDDQYRRPQYGFFCDIEGNLKANIFRFEEREASLRTIATILGLDIVEFINHTSPSSINFNVSTSYLEMYDQEMIDIVYDRYRVDFEAFGYTFDGYNPIGQNVPFTFDCDTLYYCNKPSPIKYFNV